ncbi:MAG: outer membrane beta-barrel protein [Bacteroidales bacterium]|nr:outer membrane beta-barrel protein [Bacteroidales bacterium]
MKRLFVLYFLLTAVSSISLSAQNITGKVVDEYDSPLAYANVILQRSDSTYIEGAVADTSGRFTISSHPEAARLQISFIGYETQYRALNDLELIRLEPDTEVLGKAVVKATLPKTEIHGDALVTKIENSVLAESGSATDVLERLPGVTLKDESFEVFGKGTPLIFVNGRQVRDNAELEQLNSNEVKAVEVVMNPGSRYDASVRSVIRIQTVRKQGEGFGFDLRSTTYQGENTDLIETVNMNYRYKGFDVFGSLNYTRNDWFQKAVIKETLQGRQLLKVDQNAVFSGLSNNLAATIGLNYQFNENHSIGLRYRPDYLISSKNGNHVLADVTLDGIIEDVNETKAIGYADPKVDHQMNFYYNGTVGKLNIDFNTDILGGKYTEIKRFDELSEMQDDRTLNTSNHIINRLYASKLIFSYPIGKGSLSAGTEYTYTYRTDDYLNPEGYVESSNTTIQEDNVNVFLDFVYPFSFGSVSAGLRYEHMAFNYYQDKAYQTDRSRKYDNVYPNISFDAHAGDFQFMLSYAVKTQRPTYHQLRNSVVYMNKYSVDVGNPFLLPEVTHDLSFMSAWKYIQLGGSFQHTRNAILQQGFAAEGNDKLIMSKTFNLEQGIPTLVAFVSVNPTISFWSPRLGASIEKQWLTIRYDSFEFNCNKPMVQLEFGNTFNLGKGFTFNADYTYINCGFWRDFMGVSPSHKVDVSVRKSFLNDALTVELRGHDLLQAKDDIFTQTNVFSILQYNIRDTRKASLTIRYRFNSTRSKYKGTGAGDQQKSRM